MTSKQSRIHDARLKAGMRQAFFEQTGSADRIVLSVSEYREDGVDGWLIQFQNSSGSIIPFERFKSPKRLHSIEDVNLAWQERVGLLNEKGYRQAH